MKKAENFRLEDEPRAKLAYLAKAFGRSKTYVVEMLIMEYDGVDPSPIIEEDQMAPFEPRVALDIPAYPAGKPLTRVDPDKVAAFQRKMAQSQKGRGK